MLGRLCPQCLAQAIRFMEEPSRVAVVFYYRCERCSHVWSVHKTDPTRVTHVTPLRRPGNRGGLCE